MDGFINVLKQPGISSTQAISKIKYHIKQIKKIGHTGTLDPEAAGVLPICVGTATKLADYVMATDKEYRFEITFGYETDTLDAAGTIIKASEHIPTEKEIVEILPKFKGRLSQIPPMYSAIHHNGKRLYQLAREGESVKIDPREVTINEIRLVSMLRSNTALIHVNCSKGTYVRSLCRDIAYQLNSVGVVSYLLRNRSGEFKLENSYTIDEIIAINAKGEKSFLIQQDNPISYIDKIEVPAQHFSRLINGNRVKVNQSLNENEQYRVYCRKTFIGLGSQDDHHLKMDKVLFRR